MKTRYPTVGIPVMGSMGAGIAAALTKAGVPVVYTAENRSPATTARAEKTGARKVSGLAELIAEADILLSISSSSVAEGVAEQVAQLANNSTTRPIYVDANPLSRQVLERVRVKLEGSGYPFLDASIIGLPPTTGGELPTMLVAGMHMEMLEKLNGLGFHLWSLGERTGDASFLKLLHIGASTGTNAGLALLAIASVMRDMSDVFHETLSRFLPDLAARMERSLPWMPADAERWIGDTEALQNDLALLNLSGALGETAAETLRLISQSSLGSETRDHRDVARDWSKTAVLLANFTATQVREGPDFTLTLMTDDDTEALWGVAAGIQRIGPDLEQLGKHKRQGGMKTRLSSHDQSILKRLRGRTETSELFARTDPINPKSKAQIDSLIADGATSLMIPYFTTTTEVESFVQAVDSRARVTLLCETAPALFRLPEIVKVDGVDEVHIGLTDLMLSTGVGSRYELLASDLLAKACDQVHDAGLPLHIAGVAAIDDTRLTISSDLTIARYVQLGATGALVTRALTSSCENEEELSQAIEQIRERHRYWSSVSSRHLDTALADLRNTIHAIRADGGTVP